MAVTKELDWEVTATNSTSTLALSDVSAGVARLIVCFVTSEATDPVATAISIGGQSGEQISGSPVAAGTGTTQQTISGWIIKETAIAARSNDTITITFTTQPTTVSITAAVFAGVDQTTPIAEYLEAFSAAATPNPITTVDITADSVDNYVIAVSGCGNATTATWASPLTEQTDQVMNSTAESSVADYDPSATGNVTVECTWASQNRRADMAIELEAAVLSEIEQEGYGWYNDGTESGSTTRQSQDTVDTVPKATTVQLRVLMDATGDPPTAEFQLEYKETSDPDAEYRKVPLT